MSNVYSCRTIPISNNIEHKGEGGGVNLGGCESAF
jgi:hypothetical protein